MGDEVAEAPQRKIIHCDCDCFYAAVEVRDRPDLEGRPVAVGGAPEGRGVVAACNYEARRYGVHSAMPMARAVRACPDLVVIRPDMDKYREVSRAVSAIFRRFTEIIEPLSLDEAYLDVTGVELLHGSGTLIARAIRNAVRREVGIVVSAGVAPNKFLAKIASDWNKPDGLFVITPGEVTGFVRELPVGRLFGVGPVTARKLEDLGIRTCGELQQHSRVGLLEHFGAFGARLHDLARGIDDRPVQPRSRRKSLSVERTYASDIEDLEGCQRAMTPLLEKLHERMQGVDPDARVRACFVKMRFDDFTTTTAEHLSPAPERADYERLLEVAWERGQRPVRLLGLGVSYRGNRGPAEQLALFDTDA